MRPSAPSDASQVSSRHGILSLPCACSKMCFWLSQAVCSGGLCSDPGDAFRPCRQPLSLEISVPFGYRYPQLLVYPLAKIHVHLQLADFSMEGIALLVEISSPRLRAAPTFSTCSFFHLEIISGEISYFFDKSPFVDDSFRASKATLA